MSAPTKPLSVPVEDLSHEPYVAVLCYPKPDAEEAAARIRELKTLGVEELIFEGRSQMGRLNILGKGCVSVVVKAKTSTGICALKIRRADANRLNMEREAALHLIANELGVGPKLHTSSKNFLLMEVVDGVEVARWVKGLKGPGSVHRLRNMVKTILDQCFRLDQAGLDHGELNNLRKHVYVDGRVVILDFETSSNHRRVRNVTSAVQYLFIGGPISKKTRRLLNLRDTTHILNILREYKNAIDMNKYQELLASLKLIEAKEKNIKHPVASA